jgi:hypothetical protein
LAHERYSHYYHRLTADIYRLTTTKTYVLHFPLIFQKASYIGLYECDNKDVNWLNGFGKYFNICAKMFTYLHTKPFRSRQFVHTFHLSCATWSNRFCLQTMLIFQCPSKLEWTAQVPAKFTVICINSSYLATAVTSIRNIVFCETQRYVKHSVMWNIV